MCGICGVFGDVLPRGGDEESLVRAMMERLAHRGPDDEGLYGGKGFVFGHRRLAIIDPEHAVQPMRSADGRYSLTFNGEIYNYVELRAELAAEGAVFETSSDTEVLLHVLIRHGEKGVEMLNGMFSFAFADEVTGDWLVVRDQFGIKPLYYAPVGGRVLFASEIKALLCDPRLQPRANRKGVQHYLTFQFCLGGETLFEGVCSLEPGHYLKGNGGTIRANVRYWDTDYRIDEHHTEEYFLAELRRLLEDSARMQIRSDVPLGAYLSGGVDSSLVAVMAAKHVSGPLPVFHGRFAEDAMYDESRYAKAVADGIDGEYHETVPTAEMFADSLPHLIYMLDEPVAGPGLFPQYVVSRMAAQRVKVVLGGQGGDETFGGYARYLVGYLEQAIKGAIMETQEEGKHIVTLSSIVPNLAVLRDYRPLMQHFWRDGLFEEMDRRYFRLIDRSPDLEAVLTGEARDEFRHDEVFADFQKVFNHPGTVSYINKMTHFDQKTLLPALLQVEDRMSMAVSLESRVPLLDTRIVDLVTTMPPPMKFKGGRMKFMLKKAVSADVPREILDRKDKMGFPVPLSEWMQGGVVRDFVSDVLLSRSCRERGLFRQSELERLISRENRFGRQLWGALCLELWYQKFIDQK